MSSYMIEGIEENSTVIYILSWCDGFQIEELVKRERGDQLRRKREVYEFAKYK